MATFSCNRYLSKLIKRELSCQNDQRKQPALVIFSSLKHPYDLRKTHKMFLQKILPLFWGNKCFVGKKSEGNHLTTS